MKLIQIILYFIVALLADLSKFFILPFISSFKASYSIKQYVNALQLIPWDALIFGFLYGSVAYLFAKRRKVTNVTKEDFLGFAFICPLIQIILTYLSPFTGQILGNMKISLGYFNAFVLALFISLISQEGLKFDLGLLGKLFISILGVLIFILAPLVKPYIYINIASYWFTVIGLSIAIIAVLRDEGDDDTIDREYLSTVNRLRRMY